VDVGVEGEVGFEGIAGVDGVVGVEVAVGLLQLENNNVIAITILMHIHTFDLIFSSFHFLGTYKSIPSIRVPNQYRPVLSLAMVNVSASE
jgi:hypothetical protein